MRALCINISRAWRAKPPAGIFGVRKRGGPERRPPLPQKNLKGSFPDTVIGVPACTVKPISPLLVNILCLFLTPNIPAGGMKILSQVVE